MQKTRASNRCRCPGHSHKLIAKDAALKADEVNARISAKNDWDQTSSCRNISLDRFIWLKARDFYADTHFSTASSPEPFYVAVGRAITQSRKAAGLTQHDIAEALGITQSAVTQWENGSVRPSLFSIVVVAELVGLTFSQFFRLVRKELNAAI